MSYTKFTPGPWVVDSIYCAITTDADGLRAGRTHGYGCSDDFVCDLNDGEYHEYEDHEEQKANASLIAAAPELYEALIELRKWQAPCGVEPEIDAALDRADAALAKARGES